jgi:uncharacterized repeat protein (TIGR03803 family)
MRNFISTNLGGAALASAPVLALALIALQPIQAQTFTVLYTFQGGADGGTPMATPILYNGNVYGTTSGGGAGSSGVVYQLDFKTRKETPLHTFTGPDGVGPVGGLVQFQAKGSFYGVAYKGGANNDGTLFELTPSGTFTLLHTFDGKTVTPADGIGPAGTPVFDTVGDLFGTTYVGGQSKGWGSVYEYSAAGNFIDGQSFSPDGALPRGGLLFQAGKLFGTTCGCGQIPYGPYGGSIYAVGVQKALYTFTGGTDGSQPLGSLVGDGKGNLYGTASTGGSGNFGSGYGVVFKFDIATSQLTVLHTFTGPDGGVPASALSWDTQGNLYGTTTLGGAFGYGTVFKLDPSTAPPTLTTVYSFTGGADGATPYAGVLVTANGDIWGAASTGGSAAAPSGYGTLFIISPPAN